MLGKASSLIKLWDRVEESEDMGKEICWCVGSLLVLSWMHAQYAYEQGVIPFENY